MPDDVSGQIQSRLIRQILSDMGNQIRIQYHNLSDKINRIDRMQKGLRLEDRVAGGWEV